MEAPQKAKWFGRASRAAPGYLGAVTPSQLPRADREWQPLLLDTRPGGHERAGI